LKTTLDTPENRKLNKHRIEREFKSAINYSRKILVNRYTGNDINDEQRDKLVDKEISEKLKYKPWWVILGQKEPLDLEYLKDVYIRTVAINEIKYTDPNQRKIKESILALLAIAYTEASTYHQQDGQLINIHISFIRESLAKNNFQAIQDYIALLEFDIKSVVWESLKWFERNKYRDWKRSQSQISLKPPKPSEQSRQSSSEIKVHPPNIRHSPPAHSPFSKFHTDETGNGILFQSNIYSNQNEPERDTLSVAEGLRPGIKYDPAWDDGSAFPSLDTD
ncbi:MAG: hypothetical protein AAF630_14015, partial [Cyanobacteria bacterium P01_C01_bin.38]